jgi:hypothetical protein
LGRSGRRRSSSGGSGHGCRAFSQDTQAFYQRRTRKKTQWKKIKVKVKVKVEVKVKDDKTNKTNEAKKNKSGAELNEAELELS